MHMTAAAWAQNLAAWVGQAGGHCDQLSCSADMSSKEAHRREKWTDVSRCAKCRAAAYCRCRIDVPKDVAILWVGDGDLRASQMRRVCQNPFTR